MQTSTAVAPRRVPVGPLDFASRLDSTRREFIELWKATRSDTPSRGPRVGLLRKHSNARAAARLIDDLAAQIDQLPGGEPERQAWRESVRERLHQFGQERLGWPAGYRRLLFGDDFYESAMAFARQARAFDRRLTLEQVGQALRNVWIGNSLQMLFDRVVELRPGLFAYSMLYPVTDNWLDDPDVESDVKRAFNERFGKRLAGLPLCARNEREAAVSRLVDRIEAEFPRRDFPSVYASLLAIHDGQIRSLRQQRVGELSDADLLSITFAKGGSSVRTNLYLVTGDADEREARFAFGYGVLLQLLDDLQDVDADIHAGHETLFTRAAREGTLDAIAARLSRFVDVVLSDSLFDASAFDDRIDLIRRNCQALLVASVAEHPERFSRKFRHDLARHWPVSFCAYRKLRRRAAARFAPLAQRARDERPTASSRAPSFTPC